MCNSIRVLINNNRGETMFIRRLILLIFGLIMVAGAAKSQTTLLSYDFGHGTLVPSEKNTLLTASNFSISSGNITVGSLSTAGFPNPPYANAQSGWVDTNRTGSKHFYAQFSVPDGFLIDITGFSLRASVTSSGPERIGVTVNEVEFADLGITSIGNTLVQESELENLEGLTEVTFKVHGWLDGSRLSSGGGIFRLDDIIISGFIRSISTDETLPLVYITKVNSIKSDQFSLNLDIPFDGNADILEKGVLFVPTSFEDDFVLNGTGVQKKIDESPESKVTLVLTSLDQNTAYRVKAFARNSFGTNYSEEIELITYLGFDGSGYHQNFKTFTSAATIPVEWRLSDETYTGAFGFGTGVGLRGGSNVLGYQNTAGSGIFTATLYLENTSGETITELAVAYTGRVAIADRPRSPWWTVYYDDEEISELVYSTELGRDEHGVQHIFKNLEILDGDLIKLVWSTETGVGSSHNKQIGISDVVIAIPTDVSITESGDAGWKMLSAPLWSLSTEKLGNLSPLQGFNDVYDRNLYTGFDGSNWTPDGETSFDLTKSLVSGRGLILYKFNDEVSSAIYRGIEPFFDVDVAVHSSGSRWNLLGNPYSSGYDITTLMGDGDFNPVVQIWKDAEGADEAGESSNGFWVLSNSEEVGNIIAKGQGFMLQNAESNAASRLTFLKSGKVGGGTLLKPQSNPKIELELVELKDSGAVKILDKAAILEFRPTEKLDGRSCDLEKLMPLTSGLPRMYFTKTLADSSSKLALDVRSSDRFDEHSVALMLENIGNEKQYAIRWPALVNIPDDWDLLLRDLSADEVVDMKVINEYHFIGVNDQRSSDSQFEILVINRLGTSIVNPNLPVMFSLGQNYPNPFNPLTQIEYSIAHPANVKIEVFDVLGKSIGTVVDEFRSPGIYSVRLDASGWSSGVYLYRISAGGFVQTNKMVLVK
jgi:hypothetical protein